jgi:hypothetical protein
MSPSDENAPAITVAVAVVEDKKYDDRSSQQTTW